MKSDPNGTRRRAKTRRAAAETPGKKVRPRRSDATVSKTAAAHPPAGRLAAGPAGPPAAYLYGIVRWPTPWAKKPDDLTAAVGAGVADPPAPVVAVPHRAVAALVSAVHPAAIGSAQGVRGLRRDMRAHGNVLNRVVALGGTVLPATFGLIFPRGNLLGPRFLEPQYRALDAHLSRLDDAVEVTLKASYVEGQALRELVAEAPHLAGRGRGQSLDAKIELGKRVADALRAKRDREAQQILNALSQTVRQGKVNDPGAEVMVLNASFLVPRPALPKFDKVLEQITRAARGRMQFDCVGPLPPYSFVDLRL